MDVRPRHLFLFTVLAVLLFAVLSVLLEAARKGVALAVALAAIAALVGSYLATWILAFRSLGREDAKERMERRARVHFAIMCGMPLVIIAARPWGPVSFAVAGGVLMVCQFLSIHAMLVTGLVHRRRARRHTGRA